MNWEAIGAIGELIGAIAVLATLLYLAIQVRQSNLATRAQIHQSRSDQAVDYFLAGATTPGLTEIMHKVWNTHGNFPDPSKLDQLDWSERRQLMMYNIANMSRLENMFYQYKRGFLEEETYIRTLQPIRSMLPFWDALGITNFREGEFAQELERLRKELSQAEQQA